MIHPYSLDKPLAAAVAKLPASIKPLMVFASFIAASPTIAAILGLAGMYALLTSNQPLLITTLLVAVVAPLAELSKFITRRKRPETLYVEQMRFKTYSFPSGHSYISALVFGAFATLAFCTLQYGWIIAVVLIGLVFLVGVSRVYLGAHFPSDVLAGWALGGTMQYVIHMLERNVA